MIQPPRLLLLLVVVGCILGALIWLRTRAIEHGRSPMAAHGAQPPDLTPEALPVTPPLAPAYGP